VEEFGLGGEGGRHGGGEQGGLRRQRETIQRRREGKRVSEEKSSCIRSPQREWRRRI
jgi:hypothetical protein